MRILHVINNLQIGGAQRLLADLLPLQAEGNQVKLCLIEDAEDPAFLNQIRSCEGIEIEILNPADKKGIRKSLTILNRLRQLMKEADIMHVHLFPSLYYAAAASLLAGKKRGKLIYTEHSSFNRRRTRKWMRWVEKIVYSRYPSIICISRATLNNLAVWLGVTNQDRRLVRICNGVPVDRFSAETARLREECGTQLAEERRKLFGREGIPVLMISRLVESKDQPTLIRAIKEIENKDVYAVLVGDGPRKEEFRSLAKELGVEDRIIFMGSRSDITRIISLAEIGVQSSNWEGFGLTAVEMMAGGLPLIVSDVEGLAGVTEGVALKFRRGDSKTLAGMIERMAQVSDERERMIKAGEAKARKYDMRVMADSYMDVYLGNNEGIGSEK